MQLHEGTLYKRAQIHFTETAAILDRTLVRLQEWLATTDAALLNRIVIYMQAWYDKSSDAVPADTLTIKCFSYGREWSKVITNLGSIGTNVAAMPEIEFNISYPVGQNPSAPNDSRIEVRANGWLITETHRYLFEFQAYILDIETEAYVKAF